MTHFRFANGMFQEKFLIAIKFRTKREFCDDSVDVYGV